MMTTTTKQKKTRLNKNPQLTEDVVSNTRIQFQHDDELLHTVRVLTPFFIYFMKHSMETNEVSYVSVSLWRRMTQIGVRGWNPSRRGAHVEKKRGEFHTPSALGVFEVGEVRVRAAIDIEPSE